MNYSGVNKSINKHLLLICIIVLVSSVFIACDGSGSKKKKVNEIVGVWQSKNEELYFMEDGTGKVKSWVSNFKMDWETDGEKLTLYKKMESFGGTYIDMDPESYIYEIKNDTLFLYRENDADKKEADEYKRTKEADEMTETNEGKKNSKSLNGKDITAYDVFSAIKDIGAFGESICLIGLVIGLMGCFLGFKLTKLFIGICGFLAGFLIGTFVVTDNNALVGLVAALILAILSYKLYKVGVFFISFFNGTVVAFILFLMIFKSFDSAKIPAIAVGLIIGVIAVAFTKPTIIISTSVSFGNIAGMFLAVYMDNKTMSYVLPLVFMAAGIFVQIITNKGLFEGTSQKIADKVVDEIKK